MLLCISKPQRASAYPASASRRRLRLVTGSGGRGRAFDQPKAPPLSPPHGTPQDSLPAEVSERRSGRPAPPRAGRRRQAAWQHAAFACIVRGTSLRACSRVFHVRHLRAGTAAAAAVPARVRAPLARGGGGAADPVGLLRKRAGRGLNERAAA